MDFFGEIAKERDQLTVNTASEKLDDREVLNAQFDMMLEAAKV